jgi:hypothetical protein
MTLPTTPDALAEAPCVLIERGLFYRPNNRGYTGILREAGRFTHDDAAAVVDHCAGSVIMMLATEAPDYSPACWHETQVKDLLGLLRREREARAAAEAAHDTAAAENARLWADVEALKGALKVFAGMDATDPPEGVPLNEWLPAVTGARVAIRTALARAATAGEGRSDG